MTKADGGQQCNNQPKKGSSKVGDGGGGNSNSNGSGNNGNNSGSGGGKDNDATKNSNLKSGNAFGVGRGDATMERGGCGRWQGG